MEIRTYVLGLADGWVSSLERLDEMVREDLGTKIKIHSVTDTFYKFKDLSRSTYTNEIDDSIARVVVYERE